MMDVATTTTAPPRSELIFSLFETFNRAPAAAAVLAEFSIVYKAVISNFSELSFHA